MHFQPLETAVRPLGRTLMLDGTLWCGLSMSGCGLIATAPVTVRLKGDDSTRGNRTEGFARVGVTVDGARAADVMMDVPEREITVPVPEDGREHRVEIVKLSECAMSLCGVAAVGSAAPLHPDPPRTRRIEFVGDSITCGYGVDDEDPLHPFSTATEDASRAYAFKTARALDADWSLVSYSGYGVYSGWTDDPAQRNRGGLVPPVYACTGFSYAHPAEGIEMERVPWDFARFTPDAVVLALGTNDASYCRGSALRTAWFRRHYADFLAVLRRKNPGALILCVHGLMDQDMLPAVEEAVRAYRAASGDAAVRFLPLPLQLEEDGRTCQWHPTECSQAKMARLVTETLRMEMGW